ncbi:MAG: membrane protein insertase YidC [Ilumatobacteraceae bacterium]
MLAIGLYEPPAKLLAWFYSFTHNYIVAISMIALVVMIVTAPLVLKSTKGMLEMQRLQPQMRKLQQEHRGDRQKLNEEMMKLYQEHKVNPLASCLPLVLQFPVFIILFRVLYGLTDKDSTGHFAPKYLEHSSQLYRSLIGKTEMLSWGLDLAKRPAGVIGESFGKGLVYALLVIALGALYFLQQRMIAARATVAPTMSATQQKLMQYLPVVFAVFLVFYLTGLVVYYMAQAIFRIGLQAYITRKFYHGEESLGRQAMKAGEAAREIAKKDGGGGGMFAQARRDLASAKGGGAKEIPAKGAPSKGAPSKGAPAKGAPAKGASGSSKSAAPASDNKRTTAPKNRPTGSGRPASTGRAWRPDSPRPPKKK